VNAAGVSSVYFGTSSFAATVLERLAGSPHRPVLVVAPPDSRQGRGRRVSPPPVAALAAELGLELLQVESVNRPEAVERITAAGAELGTVCAFGQLIGAELLELFPFLNVHPSLLPRWRGAAPIERAILAGDEQTGVAVMRLSAGLDSGPLALIEAVAIEEEETFGELAPRLADLGGELLVKSLDLYMAAELTFVEQDDETATYAEKIEPADRRLEASGQTARELHRRQRALHPHVGAFVETAAGGRLKVTAARIVEGLDAPAGAFVTTDDGSLALGCREGTLEILELQPPGGKPMAAADYLRGHDLPTAAPAPGGP